MCETGSLVRRINVIYVAPFVGRFLTPPTRFRFLIGTLNGIISEMITEKCQKTAFDFICPTWQVSLPDRRGQDPALRWAIVSAWYAKTLPGAAQESRIIHQPGAPLSAGTARQTTISLSLFPYPQKSAILMNIPFCPTTGWKPFQPRKTCIFFHFLLCFSCTRGKQFEKGGINIWNRFISVSGFRRCEKPGA